MNFLFLWRLKKPSDRPKKLIEMRILLRNSSSWLIMSNQFNWHFQAALRGFLQRDLLTFDFIKKANFKKKFIEKQRIKGTIRFPWICSISRFTHSVIELRNYYVIIISSKKYLKLELYKRVFQNVSTDKGFWVDPEQVNWGAW